MHQHPHKFITTIANNLKSYSQVIAYEWNEEWQVHVESHLLHYCQFLVVMSLAVVCGMRLGKYFGWLAVALNLALTWNKTEALYIGTILII